METHVKVLAVMFIVLSALGTLTALLVMTVFGVAGVATAAGASGGDAAIALPIIGLAGTALATFLLAVSLPGLVAGIGLLKYKPCAHSGHRVVGAQPDQFPSRHDRGGVWLVCAALRRRIPIVHQSSAATA